MYEPVCPKPILRKAPAAPAEEAAAEEAPEAAEEAAADGPIPAAAEDFSMFDCGNEVFDGICRAG